jgi:hypothetical protein
MKTPSALVCRVHNKVEIPCHQPRTYVKVPNILQLLEEGSLVRITLGTIDACEPPTLISPKGNPRSECIRGEVRV